MSQEALLTREKEGAGSVGASAVTLAKICVGCGVMALPWGFMRGGVLSAPGSALPCVRILCVHCPRPITATPHITWRLHPAASIARAGMVLIGAWNWYTSLQLVHCKRALANDPSMWGLDDSQGLPRSAYSALAFAVLGRPGLWLLEGSVLFVLLGVCASMQIQFAQFAAAVCPNLGYSVCLLGSALGLGLEG